MSQQRLGGCRLAVLVLAIGTVLAMSVKWTEVLSSLAAISSTLLAIVAVVLSYRGVRTALRSFVIQQRQLDRAEEVRLGEQASKFCVWLEGRGESCVVLLHNASALPVYDVYLRWDLEDPATWPHMFGLRKLSDVPADERTGLSGDISLQNVGPTSKPRHLDQVSAAIEEGVAYCLAVGREREKALFVPGFEDAYSNVRISVEFTDAAGIRWERTGGQLRPVGQSDDSTAELISAGT